VREEKRGKGDNGKKKLFIFPLFTEQTSVKRNRFVFL
jgi:hypothetical protein